MQYVAGPAEEAEEAVIHYGAADATTNRDPFSLDGRVYCKNAAVCRKTPSTRESAIHGAPSYLARGLCMNCDIVIGNALDIVKCARLSDTQAVECPVCYEPMILSCQMECGLAHAPLLPFVLPPNAVWASAPNVRVAQF